jgi:hypothetical protein
MPELDSGVWLGKRPVQDRILRHIADHHVVMIDGCIYGLQTSNGDKDGIIQIQVEDEQFP